MFPPPRPAQTKKEGSGVIKRKRNDGPYSTCALAGRKLCPLWWGGKQESLFICLLRPRLSADVNVESEPTKAFLCFLPLRNICFILNGPPAPSRRCLNVSECFRQKSALAFRTSVFSSKLEVASAVFRFKVCWIHVELCNVFFLLLFF